MASSPTDYTAYKEQDFINDPFFQDWILHPAEEGNAFWQQFIADHPVQKNEIEAAAAFLNKLAFEAHTLSDERVGRLFSEHLVQVELSEQKRAAPVRYLFRKAIAVAALAAGIIAGIYFIIRQSGTAGNLRLAVETPYGAKKALRLPDSSLVILNAHSSIKYDSLWKEGKPREIWLEGEAFFDVKHLNRDSKNIRPGERFIVHGQDFTLEVLGTAFNIRQRRDRTEIVLQQGSIRVALNNKARTQLLMKPGEMITYTEADEQVTRSVTEPRNYTAWKENKLLLIDPRLDQIASYLEDNYGKKIIISDQRLAAKRIEGPILLNNLDDALFIISTVLKTKVEKEDSVIVIKPK